MKAQTTRAKSFSSLTPFVMCVASRSKPFSPNKLPVQGEGFDLACGEGFEEFFDSSTSLHDEFEEDLGDSPLRSLALKGCESPQHQSRGSF